MLSTLTEPRVELKNGLLVRKVGLFYKESLPLQDIAKVVAVSKDSVTHEETVIIFFDSARPKVFVSEFDRNAKEVMANLAHYLPGIVSINKLASARPFERAELVLWTKEGGSGSESNFPD